MNILFTNSYFYKLDPKQWRFKQPYPPLGTLLAASVARDQALHVELFDTNLRDSPDEIIPVLKRSKPDLMIIYDDGFNYLTKMCLTVMREAAFVLLREAKISGCTTIIASSDATDHYEKYFAHGADIVIRGEGEDTLKELLITLKDKHDLSRVQGIAFKQAGETVLTPPRAVLRNLDSLPLPAWDLVNIPSYKEVWKNHHGYFSLNIATTRGCPYKCNWCAKPIYGNRYNSRSPELVAEEINYLITQYQPDHFWMCDDIFGLKPNWITKFNKSIKEKKLVFRYKIQSRVDLLLEDGLMQSLSESGCETVWVGAESGSQRILDAMDKGTTVAQIRQATRVLKDHRIKVGYFLQFGYPGESKKDIDATINLVIEQMPDEIGISVSYPLPGTKFYENVKSQLLEKQNWTDSDDLAVMYHSTFPKPYYKILQRYVHSRYRIQRGIHLMKSFVTIGPSFVQRDLRKIASMIYHLPLSWIQSYQLKRLSSAHA